MHNFKLFPISIITLFTFLIYSCNEGEFNDDYEEPSPEKIAERPTEKESVLSSAASFSGDTTKQYIRTSDIKFRVENVLNSTYEIEQLALDYNGFVGLSELRNKLHKTETIPISKDSLVEVLHSSMFNQLTIFVPSEQLHSFLLQLGQYIDFLDYRIIKAEDVSFQLLQEKLKASRLKQSQEELSKLQSDSLASRDRIRKIQEKQRASAASDESRIRQMIINDKVKWSEVAIEIYERKSKTYFVLENHQNLSSYQPSFWTQWKEALIEGWDILREIVLLLSRTWGIVILVVLGIFVYKRIKGRTEHHREE